MKVEKVNDNKVKIILSFEELEMRNITINDIEKNNSAARNLFTSLIEENNLDEDFGCEDVQLFIEASSDNTNTFILTITKTDYLPDISDYSKNENKMLYRVDSRLFEFNSLDTILDFCKIAKDENLFFGNRGDGTAAIVSGGHDDDFAMQVTGRTATWNGAEIDLSDYNLAGRTIDISYWVKVEEATEVNVTLQEDTSDGADTAYNRLASSGDLTPGEWTQVTGTITVGENTVKPILYFESPSDTASFTVDEVVISFN